MYMHYIDMAEGPPCRMMSLSSRMTSARWRIKPVTPSRPSDQARHPVAARLRRMPAAAPAIGPAPAGAVRAGARAGAGGGAATVGRQRARAART